jgi:hypothetical protein
MKRVYLNNTFIRAFNSYAEAMSFVLTIDPSYEKDYEIK